MINLFEYQNKAVFPEEQFEKLEEFLDDVWSKREKSAYYTEDENREEVQHFLQFLNRSNELKSNKFVGVIHFEGETINLLPKVFYDGIEATADDVKVINAHILWWLSYCRKLRFPNYLSGLNTQQADFFEVLIYLFGKYTKELLNSSVYQKYVEIESELSFVKGRINFNEYVNQNLARGRHHKVNCTYDSFEMDNPFNQCIKSVCRLLLTATRDAQNKVRLNDILFLLDEVSEVNIGAEECSRIEFNPMFADFETVRDYCVLFLQNSVSFNYKNELKLFAFLLPMEYVFEDFIFGFIAKELPYVQAKSQSKFSLDEKGDFKMKPDLLLEVYGKKIVADTKYKMVYDLTKDNKQGISQSDLYQMISYAIRFDATDIKLLYPNSLKSNKSDLMILHIIDRLAKDVQITINAHQLTVLDFSISVSDLDCTKLSDCFNNLRERLIQELKLIIL